MGGYIAPLLQGGTVGGVQLAMAAAYESRVHTSSKMLVPRAQFAGDTAVTLTDGSFNIRSATTPANIPKSASAFLANFTNTNGSFGNPLVIKVKRDEFTSEILDYAVFNADGTFPGGFDPWNKTATGARYLVNKSTGEIYLNRSTGLVNLSDPDGTISVASARTGTDGVVGMVDFETLQGGALAAAQQQASELSGAIQSLTSILRSINEGKRGILSVIR